MDQLALTPLAHRACGLAVLVLLAGCQKSLPSAPSELTTGIVVFEHANFLGASAHIAADISDLNKVKGPCIGDDDTGGAGGSSVIFVWNDCISSVRVAPGWVATLYRDDGYFDDSITLTEDVANLQFAPHDCPHGGLNDCITSIRVKKR